MLFKYKYTGEIKTKKAWKRFFQKLYSKDRSVFYFVDNMSQIEAELTPKEYIQYLINNKVLTEVNHG